MSIARYPVDEFTERYDNVPFQMDIDNLTLREALKNLARQGRIDLDDVRRAFIERVDVYVTVKPDMRVINRLMRDKEVAAVIARFLKPSNTDEYKALMEARLQEADGEGESDPKPSPRQAKARRR